MLAQWHDWIEESEGCGTPRVLQEGVEAIARLGEFLRTGERCKLTCSPPGSCTGIAPVKWHFKANTLPPPSQADCVGIGEEAKKKRAARRANRLRWPPGL